MKQDKQHILLLHNLRSVVNVGALFRTADAIGITKIILSGYSPTPLDRFGRVRSDMQKSALGAEKTVVWEYVPSPGATVRKLKKSGFTVIGIEQHKKSIDYKKVPRTQKMVFIVGTETTGIDASLVKLCDVIAEIPMHGKKESLNVSVAAGIVLFRILDK